MVWIDLKVSQVEKPELLCLAIGGKWLNIVRFFCLRKVCHWIQLNEPYAGGREKRFTDVVNEDMKSAGGSDGGRWLACGGRRWKEVRSIFVSKYRDWLHETWLHTDKIAFISHCFSTLFQKGPRVAPAWSSASVAFWLQTTVLPAQEPAKIFLLLRHLSPHWSVVHFLLLTRPHSTRAFFAYTILGRSWPRRQLRPEFDFTR